MLGAEQILPGYDPYLRWTYIIQGGFEKSGDQGRILDVGYLETFEEYAVPD